MDSARVTAKATARAKARIKSTFREYVEALLLAIVLTVVIRGLVIQAFRIPTGSMEDTLLVGDFLFVNKMVYGSEIDIGFGGNRIIYYRFPAIREPKPGDIIVFRYPDDPARDFIKRCVAVGGQVVEIREKVLYVDGRPRDEPYAVHKDPSVLPRETSKRDNFGPYVVPQGHLFTTPSGPAYSARSATSGRWRASGIGAAGAARGRSFSAAARPRRSIRPR